MAQLRGQAATQHVQQQTGRNRTSTAPVSRNCMRPHAAAPVSTAHQWRVSPVSRRHPLVCCSQGRPNDGGGSPDGEPRGSDNTTLALIVGACMLAGVATVSFPYLADPLEDFFYTVQSSGGSEFGAADAFAGVLWGISLFYASPLQQLLLFLGKIETQRPSDWVIMTLARNVMGLNITDVNEAPAPLTYVAAAVCLASGLAISAVLGLGLGDSIWALSTGTGACLAAGVYELGRPTRLNREQAAVLDDQWRDFVVFANARMARSGRCHESEVVQAFRRENARYRSQAALPDSLVRDLIRNWHPGADRTPNGYYRNLSLLPRVDPFTGQMQPGSSSSISSSSASAEQPGAAGIACAAVHKRWRVQATAAACCVGANPKTVHRAAPAAAPCTAN